MARRGKSVSGLKLLAAAAVAATIGLSAPAPGQFQAPNQQKQTRPANPKPPRPQKADEPPILWMMLIMLVLGAGIAGAALIPSKRGHQD
jgi:uncharacterized protein HemX